MEAIGTNWLNDPIVQGVVVNLRRVTERKQLERDRNKLQEQLQEAAKLEAIGRLAGGVAHDFNNLITVISGNVELALDELNANDPLVQHLTEIGDAATSAASLTNQLLAFSRRQLIEPKIVNLNDLITNLRKMLGRLLGEDIELDLQLASNLGAVRIDPGQFDQVIVNLSVNARDAMPMGGKLTIETANIDIDENDCHKHSELNPGAFVVLTITDSGEGMSEEISSHIFEPFFSTKPLGKGTGLGLSVTLGAVKQAGGTIELFSELGLGTTFKLYLPRTNSPVQKLDATGFAVDSLCGTETILVVEDNDHVRGLTVAMLKRLGYRLFVATNGVDALNLVESEHTGIDLLLTDLVMPEMGGRELGDKLRTLCPNTAVLYCSGYTQDSFIRHGLGTENYQFISKPFTLRQLGLKVRQVLDERRHATFSG
jgi:signal transduction histidine kinase